MGKKFNQDFVETLLIKEFAGTMGHPELIKTEGWVDTEI